MSLETQRQYGATPGERRAYERFMLKRAVRRMLRAFDGYFHASITFISEDFDLEDAWGKSFSDWRKQVEDLIA